MSKRVYKFTSARHGIDNVRNKQIKHSTIDDPFDLCPLETTDPARSSALDAVVAHLRKTAAILSFSRNWDNIPEGDPAPTTTPTSSTNLTSCKFAARKM